MQAMYLNTAFNSLETVLSTLYETFVETAVRMILSLRDLGSAADVRPSAIIGMALSRFQHHQGAGASICGETMQEREN